MLEICLHRCSIFLSIGLILITHQTIGQQQSEYTQYMYNTMSINPAYTGLRGRLSILALYRNQWVGITGAPETLNISVDGPAGRDRHIGLGLEFINDQIGPASTRSVGADFSYTLSLNNNLNVSFGLKGGLTILDLDPDKLTIYDQHNLNLNLTDYTQPKAGVGVYIYGQQWFAGLSTPNFLETEHYDDYKVTTVSQKAHIYLLGGYTFDLNPDIVLKPIGLIKAVIGAPASIDLSMNSVFYNRFTFGLGYRFDSAISALAGFKLGGQLLIGYAYDYSTGKIAHYNSGSHELFLQFELPGPSIDNAFSSF